MTIKLELRMRDNGAHLTRPVTLTPPVTLKYLVISSRQMLAQTTEPYRDMYFCLQADPAGVVRKWEASEEAPDVFFYDKSLECLNGALDE